MSEKIDIFVRFSIYFGRVYCKIMLSFEVNKGYLGEPTRLSFCIANIDRKMKKWYNIEY